VERLLQESGGEIIIIEGHEGPMSELLFWRHRMAKFNSITQQLKGKHCRQVLGVSNSAKPMELKRWKELELKLTDAANESKDNVKFLSTLEMTLKPMYDGTPRDIIDGLPALMENIRMMHTIARYYSTAERMTALFIKITNQMILKCKEYINPDLRKPEKLWTIPRDKIIHRMQVPVCFYLLFVLLLENHRGPDKIFARQAPQQAACMFAGVYQPVRGLRQGV
jgi:Dynein heavy chain, N-terminal region 1